MESDECQQDLVAIEEYDDEDTRSLNDLNLESTSDNRLSLVDNKVLLNEDLEHASEAKDNRLSSSGREHMVPRNKFLSKLAYAGVWNATNNSRVKAKSTHLTIFDWDDTLFPTSAFSPKSPDEMAAMAEQNAELF